MSAEAASATDSAAYAVNRSGALAEVTAAFRSYEAALMAHDLETMAGSFCDDPSLVRFGVTDQQRGPDELARWRASQPPLPAGRTLSETTITTYGDEFAVVTTLFFYPGRPRIGRQSQAWIRSGATWKIVHAHVSEIDAPPESADGG